MRLKINLKLYVIIFLFYHFFSGYVYCFSLNDLLLENIFNVEITDFRYIIADTNLAVTKTVLPEPQKNKKFCFIDMKSKTKLFGEKKFSELEKYYSQCLETRLDYDSRHNMTSFIWLIYKDIKNAAELSADWQKEFPKSHLPHLLNACLSIDKAWEARGTGWASSVTEEGWKEMNRYLIVGLDELKTAYELNPADPNIGAVGVIVTMGMDCNLASAKAWFNKAMNADPYHVSAYMQMMNILWPKWSGSYELAKSVVDDALTKTDFNPQLFAALPLYYEEYCERLSDSDENPKWKRKTEYKKIYDSILKKKYEKAAKKYPDEYQIRARYGMDALEQKDRELGLKQLELAIELKASIP
ncbi:MAG TPA: DUF4034 domain-containing protein, partial [bacterium]|nr:DUF4034 domain-containing protein [bacterium]